MTGLSRPQDILGVVASSRIHEAVGKHRAGDLWQLIVGHCGNAELRSLGLGVPGLVWHRQTHRSERFRQDTARASVGDVIGDVIDEIPKRTEIEIARHRTILAEPLPTFRGHGCGEPNARGTGVPL